MALPRIPIPTDVVVVDDHKIEVRGLSRAEAMQFSKIAEDFDRAEILALMSGCGVSEEEAKAWREQTSPMVVDQVLTRIIELSGLSEGASKSADQPDAAGAS